MANKCGASGKIKEDIQNIWAKFGQKEFKWSDIRDVVDGTPQLYAHLNVFDVVRKEGCTKVYKLSSEFVPKNDGYKVKSRSLYPKKAFFDVKRGEIDIVSLITIVTISAVSLVIGYILMGGMEAASAPTMTTSVLSTSQAVVIGGFGNSAVMLALGMGVLAIMGVVVIFGSIVGKEE